MSVSLGLGMENIGGIFVVLICGLILAVFVAVMEFVWSTRHSGSDEVHTPLHHPSSSSGHAHCQHTPVSVCQEMMSEFRNAVSCRKSSRSRRRRPLTGSAGGGVLRPRPRPRPLRLVRDVRFSNGQLCGLGGGFGPPGGGWTRGPAPTASWWRTR
ncbi:glutamate receptor ionotropic, kainate 5 [Gadus morhua]|uniref:glutamate receptor ionotropic, kainate 5 n=1 Tax=Gadus morhua TaxID=8049 RepID=UPI0011B4844E|nr:glutamate receptor ionotropic, kainate 5-like [Gadus morhua]